VIIVVRLSLYRELMIKLTVSQTHSEGFAAPSSSNTRTSVSKTGLRIPSSVAFTDAL